MKLSTSFHDYLITELKDLSHSIVYLKSATELAVEENDPKILEKAINNVCEALGITQDQINLNYLNNLNITEKDKRK